VTPRPRPVFKNHGKEDVVPPLHELSRRMRAQTGRWLELATHAIADPDYAKEELIRRVVRERPERDRARLEEGAEAGRDEASPHRTLGPAA